jgi:hypothetical protein
MKGEAFYHLLRVVGLKLTDLRRQKGYSSHEDFARDFDLPRIQYWRLEKGKANFTIFTLVRVLAIHNLSAQEFFHSIQGMTVKQKRTSLVPEKKKLIIKDELARVF